MKYVISKKYDHEVDSYNIDYILTAFDAIVMHSLSHFMIFMMIYDILHTNTVMQML